MLGRSRRKGRRPTADETRRFTAFLAQNLTEREAVAFLLSVAGRKGIAWSEPRSHAIWPAVLEFAHEQIGFEEMVVFAKAIENRRTQCSPPVLPAVVESVLPLGAGRERQSRSMPPLHDIPRTGDEWIEQQRDQLRAHAKKRHLRNQQTDRYRALRAARLQIAGARCEECGANHALQLHHRHYNTLGREEIDDVVILCDSCHERETRRMAARRRARWRALGRYRAHTPF